MIRHLQGTLKDGSLFLLSNQLARRWCSTWFFLVPHPAQVTLRFLFFYLPDDVVFVLEITKAALPTSSIVELHDDVNVVFEEVHEEMAEDDVSVLFGCKPEELKK